MPASANDIAMPPPISPPPTVAALPIGFFGVSAGTSGMRAPCRSAKNTWIIAARCSWSWHTWKLARSAAMPASKSSISTAAFTDSKAIRPLICPRIRRAR